VFGELATLNPPDVDRPHLDRPAGRGNAVARPAVGGSIGEAVAVEGFAELRLILRNAREAAGSPVAALRELAGAYVGFALEHPALYDAMFTLSIELPFGRPGAPRELLAAFAELVEAVPPPPGLPANAPDHAGRSTRWRDRLISHKI
jgi:hypothetical protein